MDTHEREKRSESGSIGRMLERLREIFRSLSPERREAMRKWTDAQAKKEHENQDGAT